MIRFVEKLEKQIKRSESLLSVGLDVRGEKLPQFLVNKENSFFEFNKRIIEATHDVVCAYKPNSAFYEAEGEWGITQLKLTCDYIKTTYPEIPIILDAKRADIGSTNEAYIKYAFDFLKVDAITIHPYLGMEAVKPFLELKDKGFFVLTKTSNLGSDEFQNLELKIGGKLYEKVAKDVSKNWNYNDNCMLVVGATYPKELKRVREIVGEEMIILVPGIGAQGGDLKQTLKAGLNDRKRGLIINSSRSIIFASSDNKFDIAARESALSIIEEIRSVVNN